METNMVVYSNPVKERVENSRKDFIAEAKRLHKVGVSHSNIVKVNEVFEANNTAYYVMEYLDGESLRSYVKTHGSINEDGVKNVMNPIVAAVKYLHDNRMTHLDIKPDNIMLTHNDDGSIRPVLIDFGLSKHYDKDGKPTSTINTLGCSDGYAPIEQYAGITQFSPSADIYALGATMYFCLIGKNTNKSTDLEEGELASAIEPLSKEISSIVREACALNKNRRSIGMLKHADCGETNSEESVTFKINPIIGSKRYELFSFDNKQKWIVYMIAVAIIVIETAIDGKGQYCWYYWGLSGIFKQVGCLLEYSLSIYGLVSPRSFINSRILKFLWISSCFFSLYGRLARSWLYADVYELVPPLVLCLIILLCYELIVNKFPQYSQIGFAFAVFLGALRM